MAIKLAKYDVADYLETREDIDAYLEAALEQNDPAFFQKALGTVARARGMQSVATRANSTRAGLYKALSSEGNPEFATVYRVVKALGYRLTIESDVARRVSEPKVAYRAKGNTKVRTAVVRR